MAEYTDGDLNIGVQATTEMEWRGLERNQKQGTEAEDIIYCINSDIFA